jgi:hypothetical protein
MAFGLRLQNIDLYCAGTAGKSKRALISLSFELTERLDEGAA